MVKDIKHPFFMKFIVPTDEKNTNDFVPVRYVSVMCLRQEATLDDPRFAIVSCHMYINLILNFLCFFENYHQTHFSKSINSEQQKTHFGMCDT